MRTGQYAIGFYSTDPSENLRGRREESCIHLGRVIASREMDLVTTLRTKIGTLPQGDYIAGLTSVLLHVENAFKHLARGQSEDDEQAFTDAIYRTNQAFEGSIKEAYRVLANRNPENKTPFEIETYLDDHGVLKPRVLAQFTTYRTQWRNPSTHDYTLTFDASEAFVAITSVSAFACVLLDQIAERVAFIQAKEEGEKQNANECRLDDDEPATLAEILIVCLGMFNKVSVTLPIQTDEQLYGSVRGFLTAVAPQFHVASNVPLAEGRPEMADLIVTCREERVLLRMKRSNTRGAVREGLQYLEHSMAVSGIRQSVLYLFHPSTERLESFRRPFMDGFVQLLVPLADENRGVDDAV